MTVEEEALKPYFAREGELTVHAGRVLWGFPCRNTLSVEGRGVALTARISPRYC